MATHGRGGLARLVMGSVATATLQQACVPLLLVRPATVRQASPPVGGGARPATAADRPVVSLALTPDELDLLRRTLRGLTYAAEGNPQLVEPIRGLLAKIEAAETASDAFGAPPEPRREPNDDRGPGGPSPMNPG